VAFKIFELGLKKYGDIPEYILAYIDYLSHLNGKNTIRFSSSIRLVNSQYPFNLMQNNQCNFSSLYYCHISYSLYHVR